MLVRSFALACSTVLTACSLLPSQLTGPKPMSSSSSSTPTAPAVGDSSSSSLPAQVRDLLEQHYPDPHNRANAARTFVSSNDAFEQAWKAYSARRTEVSAQLASARELAKKDRGAAMQQLFEMLGKASLKRQWIEPTDAEYPAAMELLKLAADAKDFRMYWHAVDALLVRRELTDAQDVERMRWFAFRNGDALYSLTVGLDQDRVKRVKELREQTDELQRSAMGVAMAAWTAWRERGLKHCAMPGVHAGDWCWETPELYLKVSGRTATEHAKWTYQTPYDCIKTGEIQGYDPVSGKPEYAEQCRYRPVTINESIDATLAEDAPAALVGPSKMPSILGHVRKASSSGLVLDDAIVFAPIAAGKPNVNDHYWPSEYEGMNGDGTVAIIKPR